MKRTKFLSFFIVLMFIISLFSGCSMTNDSSIKPTMGNSNGNINNGGIAAKQGDWIYFTSGESIYKEKIDGSERVLIINAHANSINVVNDWIYYSAQTYRNDFLYKVKTDGTLEMSLFETNSGDWISGIHIVGDWIYFSVRSIENKSLNKLYKMKTDGSETKIIEIDNAEFLNFEGDWIYYANRGDEWDIYKMRIDGSERTKLSTESVIEMNISDGWIYYISIGDSKIYKMKFDGTNILKLSDERASDLNVSEDWIYYHNLKDYKLYKMKLDGTGKIKLHDDTASAPNIVGDEIYYIHIDKDFYYYNYGTDNGRVYKMKTDGSGSTITIPAFESIENQEVTLSTFVKYSNGLAGELNKLYNCTIAIEGPKYTIKITSIEKHKELNGVSNIIEIRFEGIGSFAVEAFDIFDKNGKWLFLTGAHIVSNDTIAFSSEDISLVNSIKFIVLKDLDSEKHDGKEIVVFEVPSSTD